MKVGVPDMSEVFGEKFSGCSYRIRKGVYAVILDEKAEKVLTVQTNDEYYFLPGGGMENNEEKVDCLRRELVEETGYSIEIHNFIGNAMRYFVSTQNEYLLSDGYFYRADILEQVQKPVDEDHIMKWIRVHDVESKLLHDHHAWAVKEVLCRQVEDR